MVALRECQSCDLQYFIPAIIGDGALYADLQKRDWYYMPDKWEHRVALAHIPRGARVCEVGCGVGSFVDQVNKSGRGLAVGLETSQEAVRTASSLGIPVECATAEKYARLHGAEFDVVCAFQVLEHVDSPKSFVLAAKMLLKRRGALIVSVPNRNSFIRWCDWVLDMPPHHVTRWSADALTNLLASVGLVDVKVLHEPLQLYHTDAYVSSWVIRTRSTIMGSLMGHWRVQRMLRRLLAVRLFRRWIHGHTLYVSGVLAA
jgi:SAM-dependent methyltransferase